MDIPLASRLLFEAVTQGDYEEARCLLEQNSADPNNRADCGWSSFHDAAYRGDLAMGIMLLEYGAALDAKTAAGKTPLHLACCSGENPEFVNLLVERGSNKEIQTREEGSTALHCAAACPRASRCLEKLVRGGANLEARNFKGRTPLHVAASCRHSVHYLKLRDLGADESAEDSEGITPRQLRESSTRNRPRRSGCLVDHQGSGWPNRSAAERLAFRNPRDSETPRRTVVGGTARPAAVTAAVGDNGASNDSSTASTNTANPGTGPNMGTVEPSRVAAFRGCLRLGDNGTSNNNSTDSTVRAGNPGTDSSRGSVEPARIAAIRRETTTVAAPRRVDTRHEIPTRTGTVAAQNVAARAGNVAPAQRARTTAPRLSVRGIHVSHARSQRSASPTSHNRPVNAAAPQRADPSGRVIETPVPYLPASSETGLRSSLARAASSNRANTTQASTVAGSSSNQANATETVAATSRTRAPPAAGTSDTARATQGIEPQNTTTRNAHHGGSRNGPAPASEEDATEGLGDRVTATAAGPAEDATEALENRANATTAGAEGGATAEVTTDATDNAHHPHGVENQEEVAPTDDGPTVGPEEASAAVPARPSATTMSIRGRIERLQTVIGITTEGCCRARIVKLELELVGSNKSGKILERLNALEEEVGI